MRFKKSSKSIYFPGTLSIPTLDNFITELNMQGMSLLLINQSTKQSLFAIKSI